MPDLDVAFFAGVIDSRAHIDTAARLRLTVTTDRTLLLAWLARHTGVKIADDSRPYTRRACSIHCVDKHEHVARQSSYWRVGGVRAAIVLDACQPWLVEKAAAAAEILWDHPWVDLERDTTGRAMRRLGWPLPQRSASTRT